MSNFAWVTLTTNDTYSLGALVLAHSLRRVSTKHQLAVLVTPGVSESMRQKLKDAYNVVQEVNVMDSQDAANLALLARPELGITFTKLHCWRLVQFEKCVFLDSDTLVLQNCDELFEREEFSAAPDVSWPDCFNSGVFVYKPSQETFDKIVEYGLKNGSFDGGDQGLLNQYFSDWSTSDNTKRLPFLYNVTAYASYCYLPAFKQFRDKIKILHFAGKMKPWLIQYNSQSKTPLVPSDYSHATDLIQLWWNIFFDNVHQNLNTSMRYSLPSTIPWQSNYDDFKQQEQQEMHYNHQHATHEHSESQYNLQYKHYQEQYTNNKIVFHDPWEDYYRKQETKEMQSNNDESTNEKGEEEQQQNQEHLKYQEEQNFAIEFKQDQEKYYYQEQEKHIIESHQEQEKHIIDSHQEQEKHIEFHQEQEKHIEFHQEEEKHIDFNQEQQEQQIEYKINEADLDLPSELLSTSYLTDDKQNNTLEQISTITQESSSLCNTEKNNEYDSATRSFSITSFSYDSSSSYVETDNTLNDDKQTDEQETKEEAGLAGALSQLRLGEPPSAEQTEYEHMMRRQCWESGHVDYSGRDSFDNIWKKITETLENKPADKTDGLEVNNNTTLTKTANELVEHGQLSMKPTATTRTTNVTNVETTKLQQISHMLTSADIEDGKVEYDHKTGASTTYRVIDGGYEMITTAPQPNGTIKTSTRTFWDPKPVSEEDMKKEQANKKLIKSRLNKEIRIDENTTMLTRSIEGGYEEVYTTVNKDGTRSMKTKTFFDSVPEGTPFPGQAQSPKQQQPGNKKTITRKSSVESNDSTDNRKIVQKVNKNQQLQNIQQTSNLQQTSNVQQHSSIQETRRVSQNIEITENNRTVRKNSLQSEQSIKAVMSSNVTDGKDNTKTTNKKTKKSKASAPPPPADFIQNDTTTVATKRVPGGVEYVYSTQLESGKTITTSKTVYEEEETELTEEEIRQYKKTLKDAEKHKNVTTTKKLRSESGTKKVVPSENPGDVTTVETIKIEGGTEFHYTTVTAEGIVKKAVKTVYDPVPCSNAEDTEEEEIVEEYEEEVIEPGEKNVRTIETIKSLPSKFEEEVTITHEKKEKKTKRSMVISH